MGRLGNNRNKNLSRANAIIQGMQGKEEAPALPPVDGIEKEETVVETPPVTIETPVVETPPVTEPPATEPPVSTTDEPVVEVEKPVIEPQESFSDEKVFEKLSETLGRKIESYDDLKQKEIELDPEVKEILEWKERTGLSLSMWNEFNKDFSKLGDLDVAKEILAQQYPDFTKEELEYSLKGYIYDELEDDESDKIKKSIALKKFAKEGREKLEQNKLNFIESQKQNAPALSKEEVELLEYAKTVKEAEASQVEKSNLYKTKISQASKDLKAINMKLEEGVEINYKVPEDKVKDLEKYIHTMPEWYNQDGSFNHLNIARDSYKLQNFENIVKAAYEQGKSVAIEGKIKKDGNISLDPNVVPQVNVDEKKGNIDSVVSKITGSSGSKFRFRKSKN